MSAILVTRAGPLTTLQDAGRRGMLRHGISASGPMDRAAFDLAGVMLDHAGATGIEFSQGLALRAEGPMQAAVAGGIFRLVMNSTEMDWPCRFELEPTDVVEITPGPAGNYGYLRFDHEMAIAPVLGSRSTNVTVGLGGFKGRGLKAGDRIEFGREGKAVAESAVATSFEGPIRVVWGIHADLFANDLRQRFATGAFGISSNLDRMGVRMTDPAAIFMGQRQLDLVSDAIVPGDIQILGDGTPIVLMRDHQPTGGYPRIATVVSADLDRFAQLRPGTEVAFRPVSLEHAR